MQGHLVKRSESAWTIVIDLDRDAAGKRRQKWITIKGTRRDAERELARLLHERHRGSFVEPSRLSFAEYIEQWLAFVQTRVAGKTFERYSEIVRKHLIPALGQIPLTRLQPLAIQGYYAQALESGRRDGKGGLNPRTVLHHHRVLREALRQAVAWRLLAVNPCDAVQPPRPPQRELAVPSDEQVRALLDGAISTRLYAPLLIAVGTGVRRGELLALRWSDLDMTAGTVAIRQSLEETISGLSFKSPKTAKGRRVIALSPTLIAGLRKHRAAQAVERLALGAGYEEHALIFCEPDGRPWKPSKFTTQFIELAARVRVRTHLHMLRHYHATALLKAGTHPKIVSERLGHATVGITLDTYSHALPNLQEAAAAAFEANLRALGIDS
jgi:integrase